MSNWDYRINRSWLFKKLAEKFPEKGFEKMKVDREFSGKCDLLIQGHRDGSGAKFQTQVMITKGWVIHALISDGKQKTRKSSKHRIMVACPKCAYMVPFGRLHQHVDCEQCKLSATLPWVQDELVKRDIIDDPVFQLYEELEAHKEGDRIGATYASGSDEQLGVDVPSGPSLEEVKEAEGVVTGYETPEQVERTARALGLEPQKAVVDNDGEPCPYCPDCGGVMWGDVNHAVGEYKCNC